MEFTKQQFIPGKTSQRVEQDNVERYKFTVRFTKGLNVLDIACGVGYGSNILKEAGTRVDGVDISEEAIDYAKTNYPDINFTVADAVKYVPNKKYDVIVSHVTIEQIKDYRIVLENFYKWLIPGGLLIISSPNRVITSVNLMHSFHAQEFTTDELQNELKKCGFSIIGLYGQRFQIYFRNRYVSRIYKKLFKPDSTSSPVVTEIRSNLKPRYFVIIAKKS